MKRRRIVDMETARKIFFSKNRFKEGFKGCAVVMSTSKQHSAKATSEGALDGYALRNFVDEIIIERL